jgi:RNA polymerase sigma factor (sigma-70 family)
MQTQQTEICGEAFPVDRILWSQLKDGDKNGLEQIYRKYSQELFRYGMAIKPNRSFVKDCMHELFIDLWRYRRGLTQTDNVKVYLLKSLSNKMKKGIMEDQKMYVDLEPSDFEMEYVEESVEDKFIEVQHTETLQKKLACTLEKLPVRQREVIRLLFFERLSYEDTSKILGISIDSSYTLVWKAINSMRKGILLMPLLIQLGLG